MPVRARSRASIAAIVGGRRGCRAQLVELRVDAVADDAAVAEGGRAASATSVRSISAATSSGGIERP